MFLSLMIRRSWLLCFLSLVHIKVSMMAPDTSMHEDIFQTTWSNTSNVFDEVRIELLNNTLDITDSLERLVVDDMENTSASVFMGYNTMFGMYGYSNAQTLQTNESVSNGIRDSDIFLEHRRSMSCQPLWRDRGGQVSVVQPSF